MTINLHRVYTGNSQAGSYLNALEIDSKQENALREAREHIRNTLKEGFSDVTYILKKQVLFETMENAPTSLRPKFKMQGSFAYRTCNKPAKTPPQEIDLDDGLFLPVSFLSANGQYRHNLVSSGFFAAVESILHPLCERKKWNLETNKASCVRVRLSENSHIDVALYAIPDKEFIELQESTAYKQALDINELRNALEFVPEIYNQLPKDQIMLAHRKEDWKPSDPRKLDDWFKVNKDRHGEQFRRVCRYIKGWRDYNWDKCGLSSIALMSAVATSLNEVYGTIPDNRDDLAVRAVAERLPRILSGRIDNPVVNNQRFDEGWDESGARQEYVKAAEKFQDFIVSSLAASTPQQALAKLTSAFGFRIPQDTNLVEIEGMEVKTNIEINTIGGAAVLSAGLIKSLGDNEDALAAVKKGGDNRYA